METVVRRKFTDEFKEEAVRNPGIHSTQLRRWVKGKSLSPAP